MPTAGSDRLRSHGHTAARGALLAAAVADLAARVDGVVDGDHFFRQALVLANVEKMLANGILTVPESYNADLFLRLYDFPVWQMLVAVLARSTGAEPGLCGEWFNVAIFAALFATVWWLTRLLGLSALAGTLGLGVMALAPIGRFWFAAPSIESCGSASWPSPRLAEADWCCSCRRVFPRLLPRVVANPSGVRLRPKRRVGCLLPAERPRAVICATGHGSAAC